MKKMELFILSCFRERKKKWLFVGRNFLFFFLAFSMQLNASVVSQEKVNLNLTDASVKKLFKEIEMQTDLGFLYNQDEIKKVKNISIDAHNMSVEEVLNKVLENTDLTYEIDKKVIIIKPKMLAPPKKNASEQDEKKRFVIKGKIMSENDEPLPFATIIEIKDGAFSGSSSDKDGNFTIKVDNKYGKLQISFVGYKTKIIGIAGHDFLTIKLEEDKHEIDDVVVTGIFVRKKESYTGATNTMSGEDLKKVGSLNVFQALGNLDPTVVIADNVIQGSNPSTMPDIQIRGTSSLGAAGINSETNSNLKGNYLKSANEPLFIVDGFESTVEQVYDMDMDRIESLTILKDAAAKAIYGSKAANGVIVIETKKLRSNKPRVIWKSCLNLEMPDLTSYNLCNASEKLQAEVIDGMYLDNFADDIIELQQLYNSRKKLVEQGLDTDWMTKPLRTGVGQKHSLSVELGSGDLKALANVSYNNVQGVMKGSFRTNIAGSLNLSYRVENLLFRNIISVTSNKSEDSPYGDFSDYAKMNPYWVSENEDGTIPYYSEIGPTGLKYTNPLYNSTINSLDATSYLNVIDNFYLEWKVTPEIKATTRVGINLKRSDADEFYPASHTMFEDVSDEDSKGSYQANNGKSSTLSGDFNLNYNKNIDKHFFFANAGFNISQNKYEEVVQFVEGFPSDQMESIRFGLRYPENTRPDGDDNITRELGFLGVFSYMYDNRFLTDLTLRTNASSMFGSDKRWANFWSLGLGWNIHNESFMKNSPFTLLKLRGSMGSTGNQNQNTNASLATYQYYLSSFYQGFIGSYLQSMANTALQWETKFEYNIGFDAKIKGLGLTFDYYLSNTENLIAPITIPSSTGFSSVYENVGKVRNKGIELSISYLVWAHKENFFNLRFNLTTNDNEIVDLSDAMRDYNNQMDELATDKLQGTPVHKYEDGISMNAIWAVPSLGIDPATGQEIYVDRKGNKTFEWDADNMVVCGDETQKYRGTFSINGEYNGWGINVSCSYFGGGQYYNQTLVDKVENVDMNYNVDKRVLSGRWLYPGQIAQFKRLGKLSVDTDGDGQVETVNEKTRATSRFVQDYNELDISSINVYYDFSNEFLNKLNIGLERLKLAVNMNDVARISTVKAERGTTYPFARTVSCSLTATF